MTGAQLRLLRENDKTAEAVRNSLKVDAESGYLYWKISSSKRTPSGTRAGSLSKNGYRYVKLGKYRYLEHRLVWLLDRGEWPKELIDHKDMDTTNNIPGNLREASNSQNLHNTIAPKNNTSGYKGVSYSRKEKKWVAYITCNRKRTWIGSFNCKEIAHAAQVAFSKKLLGDFSPHDERRDTVHATDANANPDLLSGNKSKNRVARKNNIEYIEAQRPETSGRTQETGGKAGPDKGANRGEETNAS